MSGEAWAITQEGDPWGVVGRAALMKALTVWGLVLGDHVWGLPGLSMNGGHPCQVWQARCLRSTLLSCILLSSSWV